MSARTTPRSAQSTRLEGLLLQSEDDTHCSGPAMHRTTGTTRGAQGPPGLHLKELRSVVLGIQPDSTHSEYKPNSVLLLN